MMGAVVTHFRTSHVHMSPIQGKLPLPLRTEVAGRSWSCRKSLPKIAGKQIVAESTHQNQEWWDKICFDFSLCRKSREGASFLLEKDYIFVWLPETSNKTFSLKK